MVARIVAFVACMVCIASAAAGQGSPGRARIVLVDEASFELAGFDDVTLAPAPVGGPRRCRVRPLILTSRDGADRLDATLPQESDALGDTAIALPDGGMLVRYRDGAAQTSGILWISPRGATTRLLELPLLGGRDRLLPQIAVSHLEARAAVLEDENLTGRGDVWLLRFDGADFAATGTPALCVTSTLVAPDSDAASLAFARGALFFVDDDRLLRRAPTDGSTAALALALPRSAGRVPAELSEEIAVSRDGGTIAFQAGRNEASWDLYVADAAGSVRNLSQAPAQFQIAGHTTSLATGPRVALSDDGATIVYGAEVPDLELFARPTDGSSPPVPFTTDAEFEHSLADGSTVIALASGPLFSFGETGANRDLYRATLGGGAPLVANLTLTSGGSGAPWPRGATLRPRLAARIGGERLVLVDEVANAGAAPHFDLWTVDGSGGAPLLAGGSAAPELLRGGDPLDPTLVALETGPSGARLWQLAGPRTGGTPRLLLDAPGLVLRAPVLRRDGGEVAVVASAGAALEHVVAIDLASGRPRVLTPVACSVGPQLAYSPGGRLLFAAGLGAAGNGLSAWAEAPAGSGTVVRLAARPGTPRFLNR